MFRCEGDWERVKSPLYSLKFYSWELEWARQDKERDEARRGVLTGGMASCCRAGRWITPWGSRLSRESDWVKKVSPGLSCIAGRGGGERAWPADSPTCETCARGRFWWWVVCFEGDGSVRGFKRHESIRWGWMSTSGCTGASSFSCKGPPSRPPRKKQKSLLWCLSWFLYRTSQSMLSSNST